jgi:hypothetical protein
VGDDGLLGASRLIRRDGLTFCHTTFYLSSYQAPNSAAYKMQYPNFPNKKSKVFN